MDDAVRKEAMALLAKAIDLFHGTHELCDEVNSDEWYWRWRVLTLLDNASNDHTRDLALAEAQRIAAARRLVKQPAPGGGRALAYDVAHECNGVRLTEIERRQEEDAATFGEHARRILALETAIRSEHLNLQRLAQSVHDLEAGL